MGKRGSEVSGVKWLILNLFLPSPHHSATNITVISAPQPLTSLFRSDKKVDKTSQISDK